MMVAGTEQHEATGLYICSVPPCSFHTCFLCEEILGLKGCVPLLRFICCLSGVVLCLVHRRLQVFSFLCCKIL
jgi:hypothetical protein